MTPTRLAALLAVLGSVAYLAKRARHTTNAQGHEWMAAQRERLDPSSRPTP